MLILLTNDDGYASPGLRALWQEFGKDETVVVAPARQRSWIGKALTNPGPLTLDEKMADGRTIHVLNDGLPADCVNVGIYHVCQERHARKPDAVISGINIGPNYTASLALASGTVGGALEAALHGVLGIAVSLDLDTASEQAIHSDFRDEHVAIFQPAARVTRLFLQEWLARPPRPQVKLINLIVPTRLREPLQFVDCAPMPYDYGSVFERRGSTYANRGRGYLGSASPAPNLSDVWAVEQGAVAYTCYTGNLERATL